MKFQIRQVKRIAIYLIRVEFGVNKRHSLVKIAVMIDNMVYCLWNVFKNQVEVKLVFLGC